MNDLSEFKVYADEPSIIYQISAADCPSSMNVDEFGEICALWLGNDYPKCTFVYEADASTIFLEGGHDLTEGQIRLIQHKARAFARGLTQGLLLERRPKQGRLRQADGGLVH